MAASSIRELIMLKILAVLTASGLPTDVTVHRERTRPLEQDDMPAILFYADDDTPEPFQGSQMQPDLTVRHLAITVECRATATTTIPPDAALDPLLVWAVNQLKQNEKFDGLANGIVEGKTSWMSREGDYSIAAAAVRMTVKYRTAANDITIRSANEDPPTP